MTDTTVTLEEVCPYCWEDRDNVSYHGWETTKPLVCNTCDRYFSDFVKVLPHVRRALFADAARRHRESPRTSLFLIRERLVRELAARATEYPAASLQPVGR